jgi:iron complex outermembrane recepter protein
LTDTIKVGALFSHTEGKTRTSETGPLTREMGVLDINPDKFGANVNWAFSEKGDLTVSSTTLFDRDLNEGEPGEEHTEGHTLVDLSVNHELGAGVVTLGIENVFDEFYILSWSQVVGFRNYWSGRGRVASLTYTMNF